MTAAPAFMTFSAPAAAHSIRPATRTLIETVQSWGVPAASAGMFEVAIGEVMVNAIKHGGERPDAEIRCELELAADALRVRVFDIGAGFDPAKVPAPSPDRTHPDRMAESGYGLAIVQAVFTSITPIWRGPVFGVELTLDLGSSSHTIS
jgi:anti-sigma regulatory factor (Ser/Thr protein kinase)